MKEWFSDPWVILGLFAQCLFSMRFLVQWIYSEKRKESVIPIAFWYFSISGAILLWIYGVHRKEAPIVLGATFGILVYLRNLILIYRKKN